MGRWFLGLLTSNPARADRASRMITMNERGRLKGYAVRLALALGLLILVPVGLWSQGGATGAIPGIVQDPQGGVVPNAQDCHQPGYRGHGT